MNKRVSMSDLYPVLSESIARGSDVSITVTGTSMLPRLHNETDTALLTGVKGRLNKYDLAFYRRGDGSFVLHRVVKVTPKGYIMCGDNQVVTEHGITEKNIIAVVKSFTRGGKKYSVSNRMYMLYSVIWTNLRPLRREFRGIRRRMAELGKRT